MTNSTRTMAGVVKAVIMSVALLDLRMTKKATGIDMTKATSMTRMKTPMTHRGFRNLRGSGGLGG